MGEQERRLGEEEQEQARILEEERDRLIAMTEVLEEERAHSGGDVQEESRHTAARLEELQEMVLTEHEVLKSEEQVSQDCRGAARSELGERERVLRETLAANVKIMEKLEALPKPSCFSRRT